MGDFNQIKLAFEREKQGVYDDGGSIDFNTMVKPAAMNELTTTRGIFTWSNKSVGPGLIRSCLDRMLANDQEWMT